MKLLLRLLSILLCFLPTIARAQIVSFSPAAVSFGNQTVGTTSGAQTLTITNTGSATLTFSSNASISGTNAGDFIVSGASTCTSGANVSANGTCTIVITFTPGAAGARSATVSILDNAPGAPQSTTLSGTGLIPASNQIVVNCPAAVKCSMTGQFTVSMGTPLVPASVTMSPITGSVLINGTVPLVATVANDPANLGVMWNVSGTNCVAAACGTISPTTSASGATVTYTAPPASPVGSIFITASAVANQSAAQTNITVISPAPPPVGPTGVNVFTPSCAHVSTTTTCSFTSYAGPTMIVNLTSVTTSSTVTGVQACISGASCSSLTLVNSIDLSGTKKTYQYRGINIGAGFNQVVVSASDTNAVNVAISDTANVGAFDTFATKTGTATTNPTGPSVTTATANELVVCALGTTGTASNAASPFVFDQVGSKDGYAAAVNPTASAISPSWTSTNATYAALCGAYSVGTTPAAVTVVNNPVSVNMQSSATQTFTATVGNDPANQGVDWTCAPIGSCGSFSPTHTASGTATTWTAPALVPPGASVALIQHPKLLVQSNPATIPITASTAGSTLCVFDVWNATGGTMAVTDSKGESWGTPTASLGRTSRGASWDCLPNNVGGVGSITVTVSGAAPTAHEVFVREYSGLLTSGIVDQTAQTLTSSSPMDSGSTATTTNANDVLIGFGENGAASTFTAGNDGQGDSYGNVDQLLFLGSAVEDFFTTTGTNTYKATMTPDTASASTMFVAALKAGTGSGTGNAAITIKATSTADSTKAAMSTVTLTASTPPISVVVSPISGTLTAGSGTISITPTVNDGSNANWSLNGLGSISLTTSASGTPTVYTPPAAVSTATNAIITATSVSDPTKSAGATILVNPVTGGGGGTGGTPATCSAGVCPAFAGALGTAQGAGAVTVGASGRGGTGTPQVYVVDTPGDAGGSCASAPSGSKVGFTGCTLRQAINASGPRFIVFRFSGLINQQSRLQISNPYVYVAGQTVPGGGIVQGGPNQVGEGIFIATHDVVYRYMTYDGAANSDINNTCNHNPNPGQGGGTVGLEIASGSNGEYNIIVDHTSHRWWGNKDLEMVSNGPNSTVHDITMQWNLLYEPCVAHYVITEPDVNQGGSVFASVNQDWHHNLAMNFDHRYPLLNIRSLRWVNNVGYNHLVDSQAFSWSGWGAVQGDIIGSVWRPGPQSLATVFTIVDQRNPDSGDQADCVPTCDNGSNQGRYASFYLQNNLSYPGTSVHSALIPATNGINDAGQISLTAEVDAAEGATNPRAMPGATSGPGGTACTTGPSLTCWFRNTPLPAQTFPITADPVTNLDAVLLPTIGNSQHLDCQGNAVGNRDSQDARVIAQYQARGPGGAWLGPFYNGPGFGGAPAIPAGTLCTMSLSDGINDGWKTKYGFSTSDTTLWKRVDKNGYLEIENFLNGAIPQGF